MKKNIKKGFTLVELLVVIAILAILATVSIIGYSSFVKKAEVSNARTELTQIRESVRSVLIDGEEKVTTEAGEVTITYANGEMTFSENSTDPVAELIAVFEDDFDSIDSIETKLTLNDDGNDGTYESMSYAYSSSVTVTWDFATDTIN